MPGKSHRPLLIFDSESRESLQRIANSRTEPLRRVRRATACLLYADGKSFAAIARVVGVSRDSVYQWIDRALAMGPMIALDDKYHRPFEPVISTDAKVWVIHLACTKPSEVGYDSDSWTVQALADHVRSTAASEGHECLQKAGKSTIWRILDGDVSTPFKSHYRLRRRESDSEPQVHQVLVVHSKVNLCRNGDFDSPSDEAAGAASAMKVGGDLSVTLEPKAQVQSHEEQGGAVSSESGDGIREKVHLISGLDLQNGHVHGVVEDEQRCQEFLSLLHLIDSHYPEDCRIRLILDREGPHFTDEILEWLSIRPGRFEYVHAPDDGLWLNVIENLYRKSLWALLQGIEVGSSEDLKKKMLRGVSEMNGQTVIPRWK